MSTALASWARPHFTPGGGNALLSYRVFGAFDLSKPMSQEKYRSAGPGDWLKIVQYDRAKNADVIAQFQSGKLWEVFQRDSPVTVAEATTAPQCVAVLAEVPDPPTLDYFRDTIGVVTWLLDVGGVCVSDPQMLWLWPADEWRDEAFGTGEMHPDRHTTIMVSPEDGGTSWFHTRGMRKFGRPDLSVHGVGMRHADEVSLMLERFIEFQALGGLIPEGQAIDTKGLPPGGICHHTGNLDDPNFNNLHVEVKWPAGALA